MTHLPLQETIEILEELSFEYINNTLSENLKPTYLNFEAYCIDQYGINGKLELIDQNKWLHFILSRS